MGENIVSDELNACSQPICEKEYIYSECYHLPSQPAQGFRPGGSDCGRAFDLISTGS